METAFHEDEKSNTLRVRSAGIAFLQRLSEYYEKTMPKLTRICSRDSLRFGHIIVFNMLYINTYMHQLCFLYMLNYVVIYLLPERERVTVNVQGIVFTFARLKIVHSYLQEPVSHPLPGVALS